MEDFEEQQKKLIEEAKNAYERGDVRTGNTILKAVAWSTIIMTFFFIGLFIYLAIFVW